MQNIFFDIGIVIIIATVIGYIAKLFRQPLIPMYIITGLVIGPIGLGLITDLEVIRTLAELGIAFLLFVVGLELEFKKLKGIGLVVLLGGSVQILLLFGFGFLFGKFINGFSGIHAVYIGLILAFSSTMVVVKILSDKRELDTLHGRIIIGLLLMEDLFAIFALSMLNTIGNISVYLLGEATLKAVAVILIAVMCAKYVFPCIFKFAARSQEMLFLLSISTCFFFSMLAYYLGFSIAIGAFVAGVALANLAYNFEIIGKVKPLRDFFGTLFFVSLGMELVIEHVSNLIFPLIVFTIFIVVLKPVLAMIIISLFGYSRRTAFMTGISRAQISEFSLIIVAQGMILGQITDEIFALSIFLAIATISATSYLIKYDNSIYFRLARPLRIFDSIGRKGKELEYLPDTKKYEVILIGYNRIGYTIVNKVREMGKKLLIVDFNPEIIKRLINEKVSCIYGDIGDPEIVERLDFRNARTVISTVPNIRDNILLIRKVKHSNRNAIIFVTSDNVDDALRLYNKGADYVILPHFLGGHHASLILEEMTSDVSKMLLTKTNHIKELETRKYFGKDHPSSRKLHYR